MFHNGKEFLGTDLNTKIKILPVAQSFMKVVANSMFDGGRDDIIFYTYLRQKGFDVRTSSYDVQYSGQNVYGKMVIF